MYNIIKRTWTTRKRDDRQTDRRTARGRNRDRQTNGKKDHWADSAGVNGQVARDVYLKDGSAEDSRTCCHTEIEAADQTCHRNSLSLLTLGQPKKILSYSRFRAISVHILLQEREQQNGFLSCAKLKAISMSTPAGVGLLRVVSESTKPGPQAWVSRRILRYPVSQWFTLWGPE